MSENSCALKYQNITLWHADTPLTLKLYVNSNGDGMGMALQPDGVDRDSIGFDHGGSNRYGVHCDGAGRDDGVGRDASPLSIVYFENYRRSE